MSKENLTSQYWVDNMTRKVSLSSAVAAAVQNSDPYDVALEVGPHPALKGPCLDDIDEASGSTIPYSGLLSRGKNDIDKLASALGFFWTRSGSGSVDFDSFEKAVSGCVLPKQMVSGLPMYAFDHSRSFKSLSRTSGAHMNSHEPPHPILGRRCVERETDQEIQWRNILRPKEISCKVK